MILLKSLSILSLLNHIHDIYDHSVKFLLDYLHFFGSVFCFAPSSLLIAYSDNIILRV